MENAKKLFLLGFFMVGMIVVLGACSDNKFSATSESVFQQCVDVRPEVKCIVECDENDFCYQRYDYSVDADSQVTDILFVQDNSGSMMEKQVEMGLRFPNFLESILGISYRVAITTTDISSAANPPHPDRNGNGAFQDGKLLTFPNGQSYLDGSLDVSDEQDMFATTIKRDETENCRTDTNKCPSGDEKGILAAAMTVANNPSNFIRPVGHLAVVFITDEDENSNGYDVLVNEVEKPENFVTHVKNKFPNKSLSAHSIIVQPDTDFGEACLAAQRENRYASYFGQVYADLTTLTNGFHGDICASEYTSQLQAIGENAAQKREVLPCRPIDDNIDVTFSPEPPYEVEVIKNMEQNELSFSRALPPGTQIRFRYICTI